MKKRVIAWMLAFLLTLCAAGCGIGPEGALNSAGVKLQGEASASGEVQRSILDAIGKPCGENRTGEDSSQGIRADTETDGASGASVGTTPELSEAVHGKRWNGETPEVLLFQNFTSTSERSVGQKEIKTQEIIQAIVKAVQSAAVEETVYHNIPGTVLVISDKQSGFCAAVYMGNVLLWQENYYQVGSSFTNRLFSLYQEASESEMPVCFD